MAQTTAKMCSDCANACDGGFHHCHEQVATGKKEYANAEHLCVDTATMCHASASLCGRVSPLMGICCQACAECCDVCIAECEKVNDPELKKVIEACQKTAKECRAMAKMMRGKP
jgi:ketopantoate reductase